MNLLQCSLIEKSGNDNGFEHVMTSDVNGVMLASARHPTRIFVELENGIYHVRVQAVSETLLSELQRTFPQNNVKADQFALVTTSILSAFLSRTSSLSRTLPNQAVNDYQNTVAAEIAELPVGIINTEMERLVRQRIGQNKFRDAMLDYWGGACAVTGVALPEVLRASHTKPWAECTSDAERLDVFNGFLLSANLDALFDRFLISFDEQGVIVIARAITASTLLPLGITSGMKLRWVTLEHQIYLSLHRARLFLLD